MEKVELNSSRWLSLEDLLNEIWKPTQFENYVVSNYGRIKRLAHVFTPDVESRYFHHRTYSERIVKLTKDRYGYLQHRFSVNGKLVSKRIHKIVAEAFIPNPDCLPFINHINENKSDNSIENLEYCTAKYNSNYGTCQEKRAVSIKKMRKQRTLEVDQYDTDGNLIRSFTSKGELDDCGFIVKTIINCCKHTQERSQGYVWRFKGEPFTKPKLIDSKGGTLKRKIDCFDLDGKFLRTFNTLMDAAIFMGGKNKRPSISECANGRKPSALGYKWKYRNE